MAVFNPGPIPQGKDEMPDWTKVTKPISDVTADKSTGIALSTVGAGIEGLAGVVETTAKDIINRDVRSTVEPIREDYTDQLRQTRDLLQGQGTQQPVPEGINAGLRKVDRIQNLLQYGSGKLGVDDTYYDMRLKTAVVGLREKYPGFVDYIDSRVSAITGMNPANEIINDYTRQISQLQSTRKTEYDKEVDLARKAFADGMKGSREQLETLLERGAEYLPTWRKWYEEESRKWQELREREAIRKDVSGGRQFTAEEREKDFTNLVASHISSAMNTQLTISGIKEPMTFSKFMEDFQANPNKYNSAQLRQFAMMIKLQGEKVSQDIDQDTYKTQKDSSGKTYSFLSDIGSDKVNTIKTNLMKYFGNAHDAMMNEKVGAAYFWMQQAAGLMDNTKYTIATSPEGEVLRRLELLKNAGGETALPNLITEGVKQGLDKSVNKLFIDSMSKAKTQDDPKKPFTFLDMDGHALDLEKSNQLSRTMRSRYINGGMNLMLKDITDETASDPIKLNALKFFFSPEGQGVLNHFENNRRNPITGKEELGKQTVWDKLTGTDVAESIKKLANRYPEVAVAYNQWITKEAGASLFYKDLQNLNTITGREDLWIKYYDKKDGGPRIELMSDRGALESPVGQKAKVPQYGLPDYPLEGIDTSRRSPYSGRIALAQQSIERVNRALRGVERVYNVFGGDSDAMFLSFMNGAQVHMGKNWEGLPKKIMDAVAAAQGKGKLRDLFEEKNKEKK